MAEEAIEVPGSGGRDEGQQTFIVGDGHTAVPVRGTTLEAVIAAEAGAIHPDLEDRVIWQGRRVVALLRARPEGPPEVVRFD
jgi:hypothetical protein